MASPNLYSNGFGGTTGVVAAISRPIWMLNGGHVWYVYSVTGSDAASPRGQDRSKPLATLAQAVVNAVAGDSIVCLSGHAEALTTPVNLSKIGLRVYSEGTGAAAARFTCANATGSFNLSAVGTALSGLYFPASTVAPGSARIDISTLGGAYIDTSYFEIGALDTAATVRWGAGGVSAGLNITSTQFVVTTATQGGIAVSAPGAACSDLILYYCTFDGGAAGFVNWAVALPVAVTAMQGIAVNQLNNAHISLGAGCTGIWIPGVVSASSRFEQA